MTTRNPQAAVIAVLRFMCEEDGEKRIDSRHYMLRVWSARWFIRRHAAPENRAPWRHALEAEQRAFDILCEAVTSPIAVFGKDTEFETRIYHQMPGQVTPMTVGEFRALVAGRQSGKKNITDAFMKYHQEKHDEGDG